MQLSINQRLRKFVESKKITNKEFGDKFGATDKEINNWITSTKINMVRMAELAKAYPELNIRWLLTGEGSMTETAELVNQVNEKPEKYRNECCKMCEEKDIVIEALLGRLQDKEELLEMYRGKKGNNSANSA